MFYIARIPSSENPRNPGFYEFLAGGGAIPHYWTASPTEALQFSTEAAGSAALAAISKAHQKGAFVKQGAKLVDVRVEIRRGSATAVRVTSDEQSARDYKNRRTRD